jgi:hypothetical protein
MIRKIFGLLLCILVVNTTVAQSYLVTHRFIKQNILTGYFMQKPGTSMPEDDICINVAEAKNALYLNESSLPTDGRMPWWSELVPQKTIPCTGTGYLLCATSFVSYSSCGSYIYTSFNSTLTTFQRTKIPASNTFWIGTSSYCTVTPPLSASATSTSATANVAASQIISRDTSANLRVAAAAADVPPGPLNRCGVWPNCNGALSPDSVWIGISRSITVPATKTYYIGLAADNAFRLIVDGVALVQYGTDINPFAYRMWHIFPVSLTAGNHTISIDAQDRGRPGIMGAEIYDNTPAEITAATSYAGLNLIFSTKDIVGTYICSTNFTPCTGDGKKWINGRCETATAECISSVKLSGLLYRNTYQYTWSDGSTQVVVKTSPSPCLPI